jgi:hypothetical protein
MKMADGDGHAATCILHMTHQLLASTDDVNLLGDNAETLIDASNEVDSEANVEKTK